MCHIVVCHIVVYMWKMEVVGVSYIMIPGLPSYHPPPPGVWSGAIYRQIHLYSTMIIHYNVYTLGYLYHTAYIHYVYHMGHGGALPPLAWYMQLRYNYNLSIQRGKIVGSIFCARSYFLYRPFYQSFQYVTYPRPKPGTINCTTASHGNL